MKALYALSSAAAVGLVLGACASESRPDLRASRTEPDASFGGPSVTGDAGGSEEGAVCQKMDVLFVIDDSGSMNEEQSGLVQSFPQFVSVLDTFKVKGGGLLDYRIGVTTSGRDVTYTMKTTAPMPEFVIPMNQKGANGVLRQDCGMTSRWIDRSDPNVQNTFGCAARVGTAGPGVEMPLLGAEMALGDRVADGTNAGFLRDDALLALVFITDDEDCSRRDNDFVELNDACEVASPNILPPAHFIEFFDSVKKGRGRWAAAAIAAPHTCEGAFGNALESTRLKQFVGLSGQNAVFASICEGNLANALTTALSTFTAACASFPAPK